MIKKKGFQRVQGLNFKYYSISFLRRFLIATISRVISITILQRDQLQRQKHVSKRIYFFLSNTILHHPSFLQIIFTSKLLIRLKTVPNHPNDSHEYFLCDVGEE